MHLFLPDNIDESSASFKRVSMRPFSTFAAFMLRFCLPIKTSFVFYSISFVYFLYFYCVLCILLFFFFSQVVVYLTFPRATVE